MGGNATTDISEVGKFIERTFNFNQSNSITNPLVETITEHKEGDTGALGFTLYEYIDMEALNLLLESSSELRTEFYVDDIAVTVEKNDERVVIIVEDRQQ